MSEPVVRPAVTDDAEALVGLRALMFEAMGVAPGEVADPVWRAAARDWFHDAVGRSGVCVTVAAVGGEVVSCAVGEVSMLAPGPNTPNGSVGLVSNVATLEAHRGHGLARQCTDVVLRWFREATDVTRVDLFATAGGARIYAPLGFVEVTQPAMRLRVPR